MIELDRLDWTKTDGLIPAIVQHAATGTVLMVAYMSREALAQTLHTRRVTFYSRTRQRLWQKGEESGNILNLIDIVPDCDNDALLVRAIPAGPVCHTGAPNCFHAQTPTPGERLAFLTELQAIIARRIAEKPQNSYTARLFEAGPTRIAQKIGEEGVEVALAAATEDDSRIVSESADLMYHLLLLLKSRNLSLEDVTRELEHRHTQM